MKIDENNYLKDRTVCKNCYSKNRRKIQQPKAIIKRKQKLLTVWIIMKIELLS